jgi:hypothetical protein
MSAVLAAIFAMFLVGLPVARWVDPRGDRMVLAGTAFLYGSGAIFFLLLLLSEAGISWTRVSVGMGCVAMLCVAIFFAWRVRSPAGSAPRLHVIDVLTLALVAGYALYTTIAAVWEIDFWAIWGLKGRTFFDAGGIDWRFLESRWNAFQHSDYPLLVPLDFAFTALTGGAWDDRWLGALFVAWGASLIAIVRSLAARESGPACAALIALALASQCVTPYVGLAEGALVAFGAAAVLFLREALRSGDSAAWWHGALLLGLAANCKNEGVALVFAVTVALAVAGPRVDAGARLKRLWPAYALAAPWIAIRALHALPTDLAAGDVLSRVTGHLAQAGEILSLLASRLLDPWAWIALVVALLVVRPAAIVRERFVLIVTAIQLALFVGAYFATPYDVAWHVWASWPRLTSQLVVPVSFVVMLMLVATFSERQETPTPGSTA